MYNILLIVQILVALGIIGLVLIQHGKGADAGAAFGGGASGSVFGARGAGNFLSRTTAILALVFFLNSMGLAWLVSHRGDVSSTSIVDSIVPVEKTTSAAETTPGDVPDAPDVNNAQAVNDDVPEAELSVATPAVSAEPEDVPVAEDSASDVPDAPSAEAASTSSTEDAKE